MMGAGFGRNSPSRWLCRTNRTRIGLCLHGSTKARQQHGEHGRRLLFLVSNPLVLTGLSHGSTRSLAPANSRSPRKAWSISESPAMSTLFVWRKLWHNVATDSSCGAQVSFANE